MATATTGALNAALSTAPAPVERSHVTQGALQAFTPRLRRSGVGLALSGGGSRATLFHLGALRRLNELGVLSRVDTISSVSGGSILAAHLARTVRPWPASGSVFPDFEQAVVRPLELFCARNLRTAPVARRVLFPWNWLRDATQVEALTALFNRYLNGDRLCDLPADGPEFIFCASDNSFGINWTLQRDTVGSYLAGRAPTPATWTVGRAVSASACFPPVFDPMPIAIDPDSFTDSYFDGPRAAYEQLIRGLRLSDGGLYDNLALEPIWKSKEIVIASDGGGTFDAQADAGFLWRVKRYTAIMGRQASAIRKRWLIASFITGVLNGTYFGIGSNVGRYETGGPGYPRDLVDELIAEVRTDLDAFSVGEMQVLQNHGYLLAEAAVSRHLSKVLPVIAAPIDIPYPGAMAPRIVTAVLGDSARRKLPFGRGPWVRYLFD